jgi:predicted HAD superfamily Cof-like phosphohydrolase
VNDNLSPDDVIANIDVTGAPLEAVIGVEPEHYSSSVRLFHHAFGCAAPSIPGPMDDQTRFARAQLSGEEISELTWALAAGDLIECLDALADTEYVLNGTIVATAYDLLHTPPAQRSGTDGPPRIPHTDAVLVVISTLYDGQSALCVALASNRPENIALIAGSMLVSLGHVWGMFGVPEPLRQLILAEVHRSNMTKFDADGKPVVNEAGRVVKGPNFEEPDILGVLKAYYGPDYELPPHRSTIGTPLSGGAR